MQKSISESTTVHMEPLTAEDNTGPTAVSSVQEAEATVQMGSAGKTLAGLMSQCGPKSEERFQQLAELRLFNPVLARCT